MSLSLPHWNCSCLSLGNGSTSDWGLFSSKRGGGVQWLLWWLWESAMLAWLSLYLKNRTLELQLLLLPIWGVLKTSLFQTSVEIWGVCFSPSVCSIVGVHLVRITKSNFLKHHFHWRASVCHLNNWFSISEILGLAFKAMHSYSLSMPLFRGVNMKETGICTHILSRFHNCVEMTNLKAKLLK